MTFKRYLSDSFLFAGKNRRKQKGGLFERRTASCNAVDNIRAEAEAVVKEVRWADDLVEVIEVSPAPTPPPWPPMKIPWWERCFACFCCCYEADF